MTDNAIKSRVDVIIEERRRMLPEVEHKLADVSTRLQHIRTIRLLLAELLNNESDVDSKRSIEKALDDNRNAMEALRSRERTLLTLKTRFTRETVNIGVSGEARVGKSTTLQRISGLSDTQIPTGDGLPVTAVRSEIFNSTDEHAEITFRDQASFVHDYLQPLLNVINQRLKKPILVNSLADFRGINLTQTIGDNVDSVTTDSLKRLKEAHRSIDSYASLLTGDTQRIDLADLRRYVAYPSNDEVRLEESGGPSADRAYIVVKAVKIYCPFPSLRGVRIGLVDLPGLGEIGASVADMHLAGLEDDVDQIVPIMRPTESEGFVKQGIASNIDHLRRLQPGIKRRSDLITAGINVYPGTTKTVESLADDFERSINGAQTTDKIELLKYSAVDNFSVAEMFSKLLQKVADRLPNMDREVFAHALNERDDELAVQGALDHLDRVMKDLLYRIPLPDKVLNQQIDRICGGLVDDYNRYEVELATKVGDPSVWHEEFDTRVQDIHELANRGFENGFFLGAEAWRAAARGRVDYYNWYREEAKRLRREIIACYSGLDNFYDDCVSQFKLRALQILLDNTGNLEKNFGFAATDEPEIRIDKISNELGPIVRDEDLESALSLLRSVHFSFRNNVFLQISGHLEKLANPAESTMYQDRRRVLGNLGDIDTKIESVSDYLTAIATQANDDIQAALLKHDDRFHEYLSVSISFYIDHLYRKDFENFKHGVIRGLINNYKSDILSTDSAPALDQHKKDLIDRIKVASREAQHSTNFPRITERTDQARRVGGPPVDAKPPRGSRYLGKAKRSMPYGVFVDIGLHRDGLIPSRYLVGDRVEVGQSINVEVEEVNGKGEITLKLVAPQSPQ